MHTLGNMVKELNRSAVYLTGLQNRFELPAFEGKGYSAPNLAFLRTIVFVRTFNVSEETLRDLWHIEKKLLQLLHADSTGTKTWFLDACGQTTNRKCRLLLTNYDLELQLGLNFSEKTPKLFAGQEMGEDGLRVLNKYIKLYSAIRCEIIAELPRVRAAMKEAGTIFDPYKKGESTR